MSLQRILKKLIDAGIEQNEAKCELKILLECLLNITEKELVMGRILNSDELAVIEAKADLRVKESLPIQYIVGKAWFMGDYYKVNKDVLIPRDETELLVTKAIELIKQEELEDILDIGTGSGCIACSIAKKTNATVLGVDISSDALRIALDNATYLGLNNKAIFRKSDIFEKVHSGEMFDMVISNPPYIPYGTTLSSEVMKEPSLALFADENGLAFYRRIVEDAPSFLSENGYLLFELGVGEADAVRELMMRDFSNIKVYTDLAGIERVIVGKKR